jgi:hypothetical protein
MRPSGWCLVASSVVAPPDVAKGALDPLDEHGPLFGQAWFDAVEVFIEAPSAAFLAVRLAEMEGQVGGDYNRDRAESGIVEWREHSG